MGLPSRELKLRAKATLRRRLFNILMIAAVFIVAGYMLSYLSGELNGSNDWNRELQRRLYALVGQLGDMMELGEEGLTELQDAFYGVIESMPDVSYYSRGTFGIILSLLISIMSIPLAAGYTNHILRESRGEEIHVGSLVFGFRVMWKTFAIAIITGLLGALGTVFFIVPGVILILRWSLAVFVLVDNPDLGPIACLRESARLMRGNKWRLFKLELSFFFWYLASGAVTYLLGVPLLNVYLTPYLYLARAEFYKEISA